jgi:hypothetical protein
MSPIDLELNSTLQAFYRFKFKQKMSLSCHLNQRKKMLFLSKRMRLFPSISGICEKTKFPLISEETLKMTIPNHQFLFLVDILKINT